jgi:hypothetical protein
VFLKISQRGFGTKFARNRPLILLRWIEQEIQPFQVVSASHSSEAAEMGAQSIQTIVISVPRQHLSRHAIERSAHVDGSKGTLCPELRAGIVNFAERKTDLFQSAQRQQRTHFGDLGSFEIEAGEVGQGGERFGPLVSDPIEPEIKVCEAGQGDERLSPLVSDPAAPEIEDSKARQGGERLGPLVSELIMAEIEACEAGQGGERLGSLASDPVELKIEAYKAC